MDSIIQENAYLRFEVNELRSSLTTVTEALILFQEFLEVEIGELSYFRDSGSFQKLAEVYNKLRMKPIIPLSNMSPGTGPNQLEISYVAADSNKSDPPQMSWNALLMNGNANGGEDNPGLRKADSLEADVGINYAEDLTDEDSVTIRKVYSVSPSPPPMQVHDGPLDFSIPTSLRKRHAEMERKEKTEMSSQTLFIPNRPHLTIERKSSISAKPTAVTTKFEPQGFSLSPMRLTNKGKNEKPVASKKKSKSKPKRKAISNVHPNQEKFKEKFVPPIPGKRGRKQRDNCPVACPICFRGYSSRGVMSRHIKEAHQAEPQFPCFYCPLKFKNGPIRLDHMHKHHPHDFKSVICPYCNRKSSSATGKRNHMMLCAQRHQGGIRVRDKKI